jgi:HEAT repeat protein
VLELLEQSEGASYPRRVGIFYEIQGMGSRTVPVLVRALDDEDADTRALAVNLLQYSKTPSVIPYLQTRLQDESCQVKKTTLVALGSLGAVETVPAIIVVLGDSDNLTRCQAAHVLGVLKDEQAVYPLVKVLRADPYAFARRTAATSLGEIGDRDAVTPLINSLDDDAALVRTASLVALNRITGEKLGLQREAWNEWWNEKYLP